MQSLSISLVHLLANLGSKQIKVIPSLYHQNFSSNHAYKITRISPQGGWYLGNHGNSVFAKYFFFVGRPYQTTYYEQSVILLIDRKKYFFLLDPLNHLQHKAETGDIARDKHHVSLHDAEWPTLETLDFTIRIGSTPTLLYFARKIFTLRDTLRFKKCQQNCDS